IQLRLAAGFAEGLVAVEVMALVVIAIFAGARALEPYLVHTIPVDRPPDAFFECNFRLPAQFAAEPGAIEGVAAVVARAIRGKMGEGPGLVQYFQDGLYHSPNSCLRSRRHVVGCTRLAAFQHAGNRPAVVLYIEPVALLHSVAVDRKRLALEGIGDHQRNQLFRELAGAVVIRAAQEDGSDSIGMDVR